MDCGDDLDRCAVDIVAVFRLLVFFRLLADTDADEDAADVGPTTLLPLRLGPAMFKLENFFVGIGKRMGPLLGVAFLEVGVAETLFVRRVGEVFLEEETTAEDLRLVLEDLDVDLVNDADRLSRECE